MALRLTLIAHARCIGWKDARFAGDRSTDIETVEFPQKLPRFEGRRTRFVHAPEARARQTAALFSTHSEVARALRDCDFGHWKDRALEDVARTEPEALAQWLADGDSAPHGGESIRQVCQRTERWMDSLEGDGHVVAVTHPFILRAALMRVLYCPPSAFHALDVMPLAAIDLRFNGIWRMRCGGLDSVV
jgi:broad specificity phosphatase PhoE